MNIIKTTLLIMMLVVSPTTIAQEPLLNSYTKSGNEISGNINLNALKSNRISLTDLEGNNLLITKVSQHGPSWVGIVEGYEGSQASFTSYRGNITGVITYGSTVLEVLSKDKTRIVKIPESEIQDESHLVLYDSEENQILNYLYETANTGERIQQDILIYYTSDVRAYYGSNASAESALLNAVALANQGYINSDVNVLLNVVYIGEAPYSDSGSISTDISRFNTRTDGYMDEVHQLREQYGADLIHLFTVKGSEGCGVAYTGGIAGLTKRSCIGGHTFAHEVGHNQGSDHNIENAGTRGAYPYSYGFRRCVSDGTGFRTVMSYSCSGASRVNWFSNPNKLRNGFPMGEPDKTDNSRSINNTAAAVAARMNPPGQLYPPTSPTNVTVSSISSNRLTLSWDTDGNESAVLIDRSIDNIQWNSIADTSSNSYTDSGLQPDTKYYYRLSAYNILYSSGFSFVEATTSVETTKGNKGKGGGGKPPSGKGKDK